MRDNGHLLADILKGAAAGAAATWLMNQATTWMYAYESDGARRQESEARGGQTAYATAAEKMASRVGTSLSDEQRSQAGAALHWVTGIAGGVAYAIARRRAPAVTAGMGLAFGTGFFLLVDEVMNPMLGFTPGPAAFPWQTHGRGLGGHLAFGMANELILEGLDQVA